MKKYIFSFVTIFFSLGSLFSQDVNYSSRLNIPSPNVSTFNTYGNIPVNLYTGTPNISIPVYTIQQGDIEVPIELKYNPNNVKPNLHPGTTGLGWNLFAGGCITRIQNGYPDESSNHQNGFCRLGYYWTTQKLSDYWNNYDPCTSGSGNYSERDWYSSHNIDWIARIMADYKRYPTKGEIDCGPDEFRFNFLGYSGSLYINHENQWVVDSDVPFQASVSIKSYSNTRKQITDGITKQKADRNTVPIGNDYTISGFTLLAPDGTSYMFGINNNAIEYSIDYFDQQKEGTLPVATTWHLIAIRFPNNKRIDFNYEVANPVIDGNFSFWIQRNFSNLLYGRGFNFQLIMTVQLASITWDDYQIQFKYNESKQIEFAKEYCAGWTEPVFPVKLDLTQNDYNDNDVKYKYAFMESFDDIKWCQLDTILLPDSTLYEFKYTRNTEERLKLLSLEKKSLKTSESSDKYEFQYNNTVKLPPYISGHYDHLGFYNGNDFSFIFNDAFYNLNHAQENNTNYMNARKGDETGKYVTAEILEKIQYPTGGYSIFEYEPHMVSNMVGIGRSVLVDPITTTPGGLRIKKIKNYSSNGVFADSKAYYYTSDFSPNNRNATSSGRLSFTPQYYWSLGLNRFYSMSRPGIWDIDLFTSESGSEANYNQSPGVEYHFVTECKEGINGNILGYTTYTFTSYRRIENLFNSFDTFPIRTLNGDPPYNNILNGDLEGSDITPRLPFASNAKMRGKIESIEVFDETGTLKKSTDYVYSKQNVHTLRDLHLWISPIFPDMSEDNCFAFGGTVLRTFYAYLPSVVYETHYENGNSITKKTYYTYNKENKIISEKVVFNETSDGEGNIVEDYIKKKYIYTGDLFRQYASQYDSEQIMFVLQELYTHMLYNYIYTFPIEIQTIRNDHVISSDVYDYSSGFLQSIYLSKHYKLDTSTPLTDYEPAKIVSGLVTPDERCSQQAEFECYNQYGKPNSITTNSSKTAYFWAYAGRYPTIMVEGVSMQEIIATKIIESVVLSYLTDVYVEEFGICDAIKQTFPNAQITTYTYKPLIGMTSKTDPNGFTTYYDYDAFGRLKEAYYYENGAKKVLETYDYHYRE
jgi:YD repeat-containing protein